MSRFYGSVCTSNKRYTKSTAEHCGINTVLNILSLGRFYTGEESGRGGAKQSVPKAPRQYL